MSPDLVRIWLFAADVFILNTFNDPNPLAPIEAACTGLPIALSSRAGNVEEVVSSSGGGWIIEDPADPSIVLRSILMADCDTLAQLGATASANAHKNFGAVDVANSFLENLLHSASISQNDSIQESKS